MKTIPIELFASFEKMNYQFLGGFCGVPIISAVLAHCESKGFVYVRYVIAKRSLSFIPPAKEEERDGGPKDLIRKQSSRLISFAKRFL